ncbi:DUF1214 domain-containing protein [Vibrio astriarenae]|uniref:DUF1214 domain-containing protein n=1 Tax=Vibrio astriarenae TaxID=1481923 RepID=UPI003735153E
MKKFKTLLLFACVAATSVQARDFDQQRLERRAYEAALWGQAVVAGNQMIQGGIDAGQELNQIAYFSEPPTWKFQQPTPNNSTPYVQIIYDVKNGPVVVEVPPSTADFSVFGTFEDLWQRPMVDIGADGDDAGKGGKYFLYDAFDSDIVVPENYLPVPLTTYRGYGTFRIITPDLEKETLEASTQYILEGFKQYDFSKGSSDLAPMDIFDEAYSSLFPWDHTFFTSLHEIINYERVQEIDKYAIGMLSSIGIERGKPFEPTKDQIESLDKVMAAVHEELQHQLVNLTQPRWAGESQWKIPVDLSMITTGMTYEDESKIYIDERAFTFYTYISPPVKLGSATAYLMLTKDGEEQLLDGSANYKLTVPADVPVSQFWSVLVYDVATGSYIRGAEPIGLASTEPHVVNEDGTVDIYFGPEELNGGVNYLPTGNAEDFFLLFRFYGPKDEYNNNGWMLQDIEKL